MAKPASFDDLERAIYDVLESDSDHFGEIAIKLGLEPKCDFVGAELIGVNLEGVDLSEANLTESKLNNANLKEVNFTSANLNSVDFTNADLTNADLTNANLDGAVFKNSRLSGANLSGCKIGENTEIEISSLDKVAIEKEREVFELIIDSHIFNGEAAIKEVGEILSAFQNLLTNIALEIEDKVKTIDGIFIRNTDVNIYSISTGSCKIGLVSASRNKPKEDKILSNSINKLFEILETKNNIELLDHYFSNADRDIAKSYIRFLKYLNKSDSKLELNIGSPIMCADRLTSTSVSANEINDTFRLLNKTKTSIRENIDLIGKFIAINTERNHFVFIENKTNRRASGYMSEDVKKITSTASLGKDYKATILYEKISSFNSEKNKKKYTLISIEAIKDITSIDEKANN